MGIENIDRANQENKSPNIRKGHVRYTGKRLKEEQKDENNGPNENEAKPFE
ncbi:MULTISPECIES: hypothetical protein [Bacillaceae]|uniref:Uncharacterized protein n=1 Tax=Evansella alkalicola TaxID=745819 RepID=A0ABS6JTM7_9BACI|nr:MULTISPECIES: hypothetical protein [Bacillaceae]MBU9721925.1 hypothetical protein [Bacillus alkalicola]